MDWHLAGSHGHGQDPSCFVDSPGVSGPALQQCKKGWGGYGFDHELFPQPKAFFDWAQKENMSTLFNVHDQCGIDHCQPGYEGFAEQYPAMVPFPNASIACHFESKDYVTVMKTLLSSGDRAGVDWWWGDYGNFSGAPWDWRCMNDTAITGYSTHAIPHQKCDHQGGPPNMVCGYDKAFEYGKAQTSAVLWTSYVRHAQPIIAKKARGFCLGINGGLGSHRYPQVGSGDTLTSWATLSYLVAQTATAANVAITWFHELGGFLAMPPFAACPAAAVEAGKTSMHGVNCDPDLCAKPDRNGSIIPGGSDASCVKTSEVYTRWSQFAVFHSIYSGTVQNFENRPWKYPQTSNGYGWPTIKDTIMMRHQLQPYHYTQYRQQAHLQGVTVS